jgi:hypothetical protein
VSVALYLADVDDADDHDVVLCLGLSEGHDLMRDAAGVGWLPFIMLQ